MKPFAESCEKNKDVILDVLATEYGDTRRVLEIGSGTGQHAVHFAQHLPHLSWLTSDFEAHHEGIRAWLADAGLDNVHAPVALDVNKGSWPVDDVDAVYTANTMHIMSWQSIKNMFEGVGRVLQPNGLLILYGPFNYAGQYTSDSNAVFDRHLRSLDPLGGIRNFEDLDELARRQGLRVLNDHSMPANNRLVVWRRDLSGE